MSIQNGEKLFNCSTCVNYYSSNRHADCAPCGEYFNGQTLSCYCKVGCGHCAYNQNCERFWSNGGEGNQNICLRFVLDPDLDC